jgi:hypothetical protein
MWTILLYIGGSILGMAVGGMLGHLLGRRVRKSKGARGGALMALAFMGMFNFVLPETTSISEPSEEMKVKKGANPGDPPEPE